MTKKDPLLVFNKPHFLVKLHRDLLEVDLKEGAKKELEELAEARPILRDSLGWIFQTMIPLDVRLHEIEKVEMDHDGKVSLKIPHRRDVSIPLERSESERLVEKLNELIPADKERMIQHRLAEAAAEREREEQPTKGLAYTRRFP